MSNTARLGLFLLSASALAFEISLTRLFSAAQFYHFAFMIVSLALLGYGASGTFLTIFPGIKDKNPKISLGWISIGQGITILGSYLFNNHLPFDSFSIAWDEKQAFLLVGQFLALSLPFFFNGLGVGLLLAASPVRAGRTYAANLLGSAVGCLLALFAPPASGIAGMMTLCSGLAALSALICFMIPEKTQGFPRNTHQHAKLFWIGVGGSILLLSIACLDLGLRWTDQKPFSWMEVHYSPYKSLSYALQYPGARVIFRQWNAFSQVEVVKSEGIRSLPGFSYRCLGLIPEQDGLLVDGDELTPILRSEVSEDFYRCLPGSIAFELRPHADTLVLEPRGGLDILMALRLGARNITAVEANPLIVKAAEEIYNLPEVRTVIETERSYLHHTEERFDIIIYSLTASYHPIRSGAFSLAEDYRYTVESFRDGLKRLKPGGVLVITRWLQNPPSEDLKTFALAVTAVETTGGDPREQIIAFRGYNTVTILVKNQPFTRYEIEAIQRFASEKAFDLSYALNLTADESNVYNILSEPVYYLTYSELINAHSREKFYQNYPYAVDPPTDNRPFFGHFFKWSQVRQITAELGKTMQPFGGAGYLILVGLLVLATILAGVVILLPLGLAQRNRQPVQIQILLYFGMLGLGFFLVEIPLMQQFILFLGQPAYAMTCVLFSILFFSAMGSQISKSIPLLISLCALIVLLALIPIFLPVLFSSTFRLPLSGRLLVSIFCLAPVGFLMGMPLPEGIRRLSARGSSALIPWAWGVNGATSVIAAVLAALLAISLGFNWVFWLGALCYGIALLMVLVGFHHRSQSHDQ